MKYVNEYYPYVCTCQEETDVFVNLMKATASAMVVMSGCTAAAQQNAANNNQNKPQKGQTG